MYSDGDDPKGPGFPIRISTDQSLFAAPHGFSQRTTSFIASRRQGIHQTPLRRLIDPTSNGQRPMVSSTTGRSPEDGTSSALYYPVSTTERSNSPDHLVPPHLTVQREPTRTGLARSSRSSPCPTAGTGTNPAQNPRPASPSRETPDQVSLLSAIEPAFLSERPAIKKWWAREDLNFRPHAYQARALTN